MIYDGFADVYDAFMADVDYERWAEFYLSMADRCGIHITRAVECACGTGGLTLPLSRHIRDLLAFDQSTTMLQKASDKALQQGKHIRFSCQDMRSFVIHKCADAIISCCDGVNYLLTSDDLEAFFLSANRALRVGGGIFFDISSSYKLEMILANNCYCQDLHEAAYLWVNHFDHEKRIQQMDLTFFVKQKNGMYKRYAETHFQKAHSPQEITLLLQKCGFDNVQIYGDKIFTAPSAHCQRIHFSATKQG